MLDFQVGLVMIRSGFCTDSELEIFIFRAKSRTKPSWEMMGGGAGRSSAGVQTGSQMVAERTGSRTRCCCWFQKKVCESVLTSHSHNAHRPRTGLQPEAESGALSGLGSREKPVADNKRVEARIKRDSRERWGRRVGTGPDRTGLYSGKGPNGSRTHRDSM